LQYIIRDIPNYRPSVQSNIPFINNIANIDIDIDNNISTSNYIIDNSLLIINPDFRNQNINITVSAINTSNLYKILDYNSINYLSDQFTFIINELDIPNISLEIKYINSEYTPIHNINTYIFNPNFVNYNLKHNQIKKSIILIDKEIREYSVKSNKKLNRLNKEILLDYDRLIEKINLS
jgi:hypothetical protein